MQLTESRKHASETRTQHRSIGVNNEGVHKQDESKTIKRRSLTGRHKCRSVTRVPCPRDPLQCDIESEHHTGARVTTAISTTGQCSPDPPSSTSTESALQLPTPPLKLFLYLNFHTQPWIRNNSPEQFIGPTAQPIHSWRSGQLFRTVGNQRTTPSSKSSLNKNLT